MAAEACGTCAKLLSAILPLYDEKTEKYFAYDRQLECCGRFICGVCIAKNSRFALYCPFCQISTTPTALPQGLRDPPAYSPPSSPNATSFDRSPASVDKLPAYSSLDLDKSILNEKGKSLREGPAEDVLHFLDPLHDTILSLSLRYGVPQGVLRRTNGLFADHLLAARRTILIPGEFYKGGVSLSPQPIEGEEEEIRKAKVRRWMVACKVAEYNVALLYLEQSKYDLDAAVEAYLADDKWEREHPIQSSTKGMSKQKPDRGKDGLTYSLAGQL
ncbi:hypothetical protein MMC07_007661 [Pseudocyphellaria aurata]|nr:hypothetical protein [Pseudocyphellaria aurata]